MMHFSSIISPDLVCMESPILNYSNLIESGQNEELHPKEVELIFDSPPKRQNEFITGRICVRRALQKLKIYNYPILYNEYKVPIFPSTINGSISHTSKNCFVIIGFSRKYLSIGVDIEEIQKVRPEYFDTICTKDELLFLKKYSDKEQLEKVTLFFTAKEAFYKLQFQLTNEMLFFKDINCSILDDKTFSITLNKHLCKRFSFNTTFSGNYNIANGIVYSALFLENN